VTWRVPNLDLCPAAMSRRSCVIDWTRPDAVARPAPGHPLYYYAPDSKQGQITGQGLDQFGAPWSVLSPSGPEIHTKP
jgi:hypothetical protein